MALWTNKDVAGAVPKYLPVGRLLRINVTNGGTGYTDGATVAVTIGAPGTGGVQAVATAVVVGGIVQSITLTNQGTRYAAAPAVTMATGTGLVVSVSVEAIIYDAREIVFVDNTEASLASNKSKGLVSPGWWWYRTFKDSSGDTRYKAEHLVALSALAADAGDVEDAIVPDVETSIAISVQPVSQSIDLAVATQVTFTVTAAGTPVGGLTYQWQSAQVGSTKYVDLSGKTTASLLITALDETFDGLRYRVKISKTGAKDVVSTPVTLTIIPA